MGFLAKVVLNLLRNLFLFNRSTEKNTDSCTKAEDGYESTVERTGHGLQRTFIVTMLQHLAAARGVEMTPEDGVSEENASQESGGTHLPSLVLAIEEPELYQHPSRQRHWASVLLKLATGTTPGVAKNTQVVYTTHSPLLVGLDRFEHIRVLRKSTHENGKPKTTRLKKVDMDAVADELWTAKKLSRDKIYGRNTTSPPSNDNDSLDE